MIRVEVREYCHNCFDFEPNVQSPEKFFINSEQVAGQTDTIIRCKNRNCCENLKRYLDKELGRV